MDAAYPDPATAGQRPRTRTIPESAGPWPAGAMTDKLAEHVDLAPTFAARALTAIERAHDGGPADGRCT